MSEPRFSFKRRTKASGRPTERDYEALSSAAAPQVEKRVPPSRRPDAYKAARAPVPQKPVEEKPCAVVPGCIYGTSKHTHTPAPPMAALLSRDLETLRDVLWLVGKTVSAKQLAKRQPFELFHAERWAVHRFADTNGLHIRDSKAPSMPEWLFAAG